MVSRYCYKKITWSENIFLCVRTFIHYFKINECRIFEFLLRGAGLLVYNLQLRPRLWQKELIDNKKDIFIMLMIFIECLHTIEKRMQCQIFKWQDRFSLRRASIIFLQAIIWKKFLYPIRQGYSGAIASGSTTCSVKAKMFLPQAD